MSLFASALSAFAPTLGALISNPTAKNLIEKVAELLTGKKLATDAELLSALQKANPEILVKLKQLDLEAEARHQEFGLDIIDKDAQDRNSARAHELRLAKQKKRPWTTAALAFFIFAGYLAVLLTVLHSTAPWGEKVIFMLLAPLISVLPIPIQYFYGGGHDSLIKSELKYDNGRLGR